MGMFWSAEVVLVESLDIAPSSSLHSTSPQKENVVELVNVALPQVRSLQPACEHLFSCANCLSDTIIWRDRLGTILRNVNQKCDATPICMQDIAWRQAESLVRKTHLSF
jgi:hypothetical protein